LPPHDTATPPTYPLSLHDALPIWPRHHQRRAEPTAADRRRPKPGDSPRGARVPLGAAAGAAARQRLTPCATRPPTDVDRSAVVRSEEHTSELQSRENLVCRLLLEK